MTEHERFVRITIKGRLSGRRVGRPGSTVATPAETVKHLTRMQHRHGANVLEPYEERLLARLQGAV